MRHPESPATRTPSRHDGWTIQRQIAFLEFLRATRSVSTAARAAGMSREGAYRLRNRPDAALFAAIWDRLLCAGRPAPSRAEVDEGHMAAIRRAVA